MHRSVYLLFISILMFLPPTLQAEQEKKISRVDNMLAVFDFEVQGNVDQFIARALTDSVRIEIVKSRKYDVIDRSNMDKIMKEQAFQMAACTGKECAIEAGQLLGVGKIVIGTVSLVGKTYYLTLALVDVETGKTAAIEEDMCKCEVDDLIASSKRAAHKLLGGTGEEPVMAINEGSPKAEPAAAAPKGKAKAGKGAAKQEAKADAPEAAETADAYKDPVTGMEFTLVKGGCFDMGDVFGDGDSDEKPVHEVCVEDYYIGKHEVTQGQWQEVMKNNPSYFKKCGVACPVENLNYDDVAAFIQKLNERANRKFRLPTEAEWEFAARSGGKREKWPGTNDDLHLDEYAWLLGVRLKDAVAGPLDMAPQTWKKVSDNKTHPVGTKKPNGLGLHDMSGNVSEFVMDRYGNGYYSESPKNNPQGPDKGVSRVIRGGSWTSKAEAVRTTDRRSTSSMELYSVEGEIGFRLALPVAKQAEAQ